MYHENFYLCIADTEPDNVVEDDTSIIGGTSTHASSMMDIYAPSTCASSEVGQPISIPDDNDNIREEKNLKEAEKKISK